jgi:16S rRNA (uracil1498-N3)-methyltransferase
LAECVVTSAAAGVLELAVQAVRTEPAGSPAIAVVQAIPKGDRGELAVELMTEVGVDVIVPWAAERCVARWRGDRAVKSEERWRSAAVQAAKQARRAWFPRVAGQAGLAEVAERARAASLAVVLDPDGAMPLAGLAIPAHGEVVLVVGPEGGFGPAEDEALRDAGAVSARLGPTVLRASTAGAVAAALVLSRSGRWP